MRIKISFTIKVEKANKPEADYREVDIPGTSAERFPEESAYVPQDRKIGFRA